VAVIEESLFTVKLADLPPACSQVLVAH